MTLVKGAIASVTLPVMILAKVVIAVVILLVIQDVTIVSQAMALVLDMPAMFVTPLVMTTTLLQVK